MQDNYKTKREEEEEEEDREEKKKKQRKKDKNDTWRRQRQYSQCVDFYYSLNDTRPAV